MIDIDSPQCQKKGIMFIPGEIEDNAYAQFRGGGKEGGGGCNKVSYGRCAQTHFSINIVHRWRQWRFKLIWTSNLFVLAPVGFAD